MNAFVQSGGTSRTQGRLLTAVIAAIVLVLLGAPLVILFITSLRPPTALLVVLADFRPARSYLPYHRTTAIRIGHPRAQLA